MTSKYIFIQEFEHDDGYVERITHEFKTDFQDTVLARFADFMRGCGFVISPYENLEFVSEQEDTCSETGEAHSSWDTEEWEEQCEQEEDTSHYINDLDHSAGAAWPFPTARPKEGTDFPNWGGEKCDICGMTRQQMGTSPCYDEKCSLGLYVK